MYLPFNVQIFFRENLTYRPFFVRHSPTVNHKKLFELMITFFLQHLFGHFCLSHRLRSYGSPLRMTKQTRKSATIKNAYKFKQLLKNASAKIPLPTHSGRLRPLIRLRSSGGMELRPLLRRRSPVRANPLWVRCKARKSTGCRTVSRSIL